MYDGFSQFHQFHLEGLGYRGIKFGEALDFYQTDISLEGPNPVLPSGGNIGSGRSRFWMHTDCIQQLQDGRGRRSGVKLRSQFRRSHAVGRQLYRVERHS
jgi:hypothetical protein